MTGAFITLEGGEGAGKSTQARAVAAALVARGHDVLATREPGGSPGAEALRELLLFGQHDLAPRAEIVTHFAARFDHVDRVIRPALAAGKIVLCDRFFDSTLAYQGYGRGDGDPGQLALIRAMIGLVGISPDLTFLLEVSPETAKSRLTARGGDSDRYEREGAGFHQRVAEGFRIIAAAEPKRVIRISTDLDPVEAITADLVQRIEARMAESRMAD